MAANRRTSELDIICIPDAVWKAPLWTNRQQIMSRIPRLFSEARVLYVEPPRFLVSYLRWRLSGTTDANLSGFGYRCVPVQDRLWVLQSAFPVPNRVGRNYMFGLLKRWIMYLIGICQEQLGFGRPVLWSYSPFAIEYVGHLNERLVCYDCVDDYVELPYYRAFGPSVKEFDIGMTAKADVVFTTSQPLYEAKRKLNANTHLLENAVDFELFSQASREDLPLPHDLIDLPYPVIGYYGALDDYRMDYSLLRQVALAYPRCSVALIGPTWPSKERDAMLQGLGNVYLLGAKPQGDLPQYLAHFDVCLMPYRLTDHIRQSCPLKLHEYLASGKPVVSVDIAAVTKYREVLHIASSPTEFVNAVQVALEEDGSLRSQRVEIARQHSWEAKARRMVSIILEILAESHPAAQIPTDITSGEGH